MSIIKYFVENGCKMFDVSQALKDSGWDIELQDILQTKGLKLVSRNDSQYQVTISSIRFDEFMNMFFVSFLEGGWLCLDHAIEQFTRDDGERNDRYTMA